MEEAMVKEVKDGRTEKTPIEAMIYRYPQLTLLPGEGMSQDEAYIRIARRGKFPQELSNTYHSSPKDFLRIEKTIAGNIECLYLDNREDFERFVQVLAYRCENRVVPASMGAVTITNLNNWRKIEAHKKSYLLSGGTDWKGEFQRFTSIPENYKDTLVIVGSGGYSGISAQSAGFEDEEWLRLSMTIRLYHEMAHVVFKRMYKKEINPLIEEVVADAAGIYKAFGAYLPALAKKFLGIEEKEYRQGGRLENYLKENQTVDQVRPEIEQKIEQMDEYLKNFSANDRDIFEILLDM